MGYILSMEFSFWPMFGRIAFWVFLIGSGLGLEWLWRRRRLQFAVGPRWKANIGLMLIVRLFGAFPRLWLYVPVSLWLSNREIGLLYHVDWPLWVKYAVIWLYIDLVHYWAHRLNHTVPFLWRVHSVHHTDLEVDVTTTDRVHPLHTFINVPISWCNLLMGYGFVGLPFKALKNIFSITSHLNIDLPFGLDRVLRYVFITPNIHLLHHSTVAEEQASNFGSLLSIWDRLFGTYRDPPPGRPEEAVYGLPELQDQARLGFWGLLTLPFMRDFPTPTLVTVAARRAAAGAAPPERIGVFSWAAGVLALLGVTVVVVILGPALAALVEPILAD